MNGNAYKIYCDLDLWKQAKVSAAQQGKSLISAGGWITEAIQAKLAADNGQAIDWTKTSDFKRLAREFCKSEGWTVPKTKIDK